MSDRTSNLETLRKNVKQINHSIVRSPKKHKFRAGAETIRPLEAAVFPSSSRCAVPVHNAFRRQRSSDLRVRDVEVQAEDKHSSEDSNGVNTANVIR